MPAEPGLLPTAMARTASVWPCKAPRQRKLPASSSQMAELDVATASCAAATSVPSTFDTSSSPDSPLLAASLPSPLDAVVAAGSQARSVTSPRSPSRCATCFRLTALASLPCSGACTSSM